MACFYRADAQNNRPALIPAGGKLGVMSQTLGYISNLKIAPD